MKFQMMIKAICCLSWMSLSVLAQSEIVALGELGVKNLGLETVLVKESDFEVTAFALGRTGVIPEKRSYLSSRISGRVLESDLVIGSYVEKGDKLLKIESRRPGDPPPSVWLEAPANGNILAVDTALGSPVEPTQRLAEIADLSQMYLVVVLPQSTAGKIKQGMQARVHFPLRPGKDYMATLLQHSVCPCPEPSCALGQDMSTRNEDGDEDRNSAGVVFVIDNPDNLLRPEMNAECSIILDKREGVMSVPNEAVHGGPGDRHVWVKHVTLPNAFEKVSVQTGLTSNGRTEIVDGLFQGDEVVTRGSYSLGYAGKGGGLSLKEVMDAAHGHEHNEDGSEMTEEDRKRQQANQQNDHHDEISTREMIFMGSTAILAIALIAALLSRRTSGGSNTEHS